jgi:hypothetical protein
MFDLNQAISSAGMGSAAGPWGMVAGGLLGGFMGGMNEPETYSSEDYERDMAPYKEMIDKQMAQSQSLQDPNSMINRRMYQQSQQRAMDSMGVANTIANRNMAQQGGGLGNSGLLQATVNQNLAQYSNQGLLAGDAQFQNMFKEGVKMQEGLMSHLGDYQSGLAETNINQIAANNKFNLAQDKANQQAMGDLLGNQNIFGKEGSIAQSTLGQKGLGGVWDKYGWDGWLPFV